MSILIAEDNEAQRRYLCDLIRDKFPDRIPVIEAHDGESAVRLERPREAGDDVVLVVSPTQQPEAALAEADDRVVLPLVVERPNVLHAELSASRLVVTRSAIYGRISDHGLGERDEIG